MDVLQSVFASVDAIAYRCKNDDDYTMEQLEGSVDTMLGYGREDILANATVSWVGLMMPEDRKRIGDEIDAAIEAGKSWDVVYRMCHKSGRVIWVRERGAAKFANGALTYLEGIVVSAQAEIDLREEMERVLADSLSENREIVKLAGQIEASLRQLSILSVNARIEAARSGDAGRGFAVVAEAINELASTNSTWLTQITTLLERETKARKAA